jgi:signal transduction histidine kinase
MAGGICHELNQPLQYISGASEILLMDISDNAQLNDMLCNIRQQVDRMARITRKLMSITRYKTRAYVGGQKIIDIERSSCLGNEKRSKSAALVHRAFFKQLP